MDKSWISRGRQDEQGKSRCDWPRTAEFEADSESNIGDNYNNDDAKFEFENPERFNTTFK